MNRDRFELALTRIGPEDGVLFEQLASSFAALEYGNLRTLASVGGDGGRDAILYTPDDDQGVVFQYSVTVDFSGKILRTAKRLQETVPDAREIIYFTSQVVGPKGDEVKKRARKEYRLSVDIRDRSWFLDRVNLHAQSEQAAESLARIKVDPLISKIESGTPGVLPGLTSEEEAEAAFFLEVNYGNEDRKKGLTKASFDSLVRAALRGTDSQNRLPRSEVIAKVSRMLPSGRDYAPLVNSSLARLGKSSIRHWRQADEFCLSHDEVEKVKDRAAHLLLLQEEFRSELIQFVTAAEEFLGQKFSESDKKLAAELAEYALDKMLLDRGRAFAEAVAVDRVSDYQSESISPLIDAAISGLGRNPSRKVREAAAYAVGLIFTAPSRGVAEYLRGKIESHTLFALLQATPDVQKTVVKLFSGGVIWLDANLLLPVLAEELADEESRGFTNLLHVARECGISLRVTSGVTEELSMHMRRSLAYARVAQQGGVWDGDVPFLASAHVAAGNPLASLGSWLENFRGADQPMEDVAEYLEDEHGIRVQDLKAEAERADIALRGAVQEIWYESKARRAKKFSQETVQTLVNHDVECYLGVVSRRRGENRSPLGFNSWWLTLDSTAFKVHALLRDRISGEVPPPPVMSPDFLLRYLEIGPLRAEVSNSSRAKLPVLLDISFLEGVSPQMMSVVDGIRQENAALPPRVLRRKIRDTMNKLKAERGRISEGGVALVEQEVLDSIRA
ncbi:MULTISPECIES: hypothetical protein [unclassified Kitasatospora]|uniref:hypothetical protein n=1 Tax=unclassified Kitasatospora TaxID=2633591 RepID=UPI0033DDA15A